ncbi:hypothetical protein DL766_000055 [Monosporascus sp. MC13-8B]|uniref:Haloacid dehalogenase n=1 Tax=Monosporascus cannonballus TaxID=155416 RepID=A0ABY0GWH2_9PEZI|nr:hypothetical protein DL762_008586 [Monosporascus cannonballus]RYO83316.1 hypothetical protein DL763_007913 [Monosporascus cannonballus]RYP40031.1 hypothetical protein DL766_000055 [Monosporascus sp. MC13-8B]
MRPSRRPPCLNPPPRMPTAVLAADLPWWRVSGVAPAAWRLAWSANLILGAGRAEARQEAVEGVVFLRKVDVINPSAGRTVVDWRSTVHEELVRRAREEIDSPAHKRLPGSLRARLKALTRDEWATLAQQWRDGYAPNRDPSDVAARWRVHGRGDTLLACLAWHFLEPWGDSAAGIQRLGTRFVTATRPNGNQAPLKDFNEHGGLGFRGVIFSADFGAYKPNPQTYLGAVCALGLEPHKVAMVAAHLYDPESARANGLRTIYVERAPEGAWVPEEDRYQEARSWADQWVGEKDEGFVELARQLGVYPSSIAVRWLIFLVPTQ